jgi:putative toxin-antitoxin system antitoxin component (TIGR02293 family)
MLSTKLKRRKANKPGVLLENQNPLELIKSIKSGFPTRVVKEFQKETGLILEQIAAWTGIHPRTLARRLAKGKLTSDESDRVCRVKRLWHLAVELFEGNARDARDWIASPLRFYEGLTPIELSSTETGAKELEMLIGRLEHGIFQ